MLQKEYGERAEKIAAAKSGGVSVRFVTGAENYVQKTHVKTPIDGNYIFENFVRDEGFDMGDYTFQSVGSIAICDCVSPCDSLLDCCAAPGGKSVLLAAKCGHVTSFELHEHRVELITQYKRRMGVENITELQKDSAAFDEKYEEKFDAVLCDAPCSGYGTISENPDIKLFRKKEDFAALAKTQAAVLDTCSRYVKTGGALYYSTCSVFGCENDEIVGAFLKKHGEYTLEPLDSPLPHDKITYGLQFLPDRAYVAGFYVAKLVKMDR